MAKQGVKRGDTVTVIAGKNRGKAGKVLRVIPKEDKVIVEGLNLYKKHIRPKQQGGKGETIQVARPIHISNVAKAGQ